MTQLQLRTSLQSSRYKHIRAARGDTHRFPPVRVCYMAPQEARKCCQQPVGRAPLHAQRMKPFHPESQLSLQALTSEMEAEHSFLLHPEPSLLLSSTMGFRLPTAFCVFRLLFLASSFSLEFIIILPFLSVGVGLVSDSQRSKLIAPLVTPHYVVLQLGGVLMPSHFTRC